MSQQSAEVKIMGENNQAACFGVFTDLDVFSAEAA